MRAFEAASDSALVLAELPADTRWLPNRFRFSGPPVGSLRRAMAWPFWYDS